MRIEPTEAITLLKEGGLVALPTETVYGLAARYDHEAAIEKIFHLKQRPQDNPLILHVDSLETMRPFLLEEPKYLNPLAKQFWPGPLTLILPIRQEMIPGRARSNLPTAAFRIPNQRETLKILRETGPLVMPSANLSGKPSATSSSHLIEDFGKALPFIEGGETIHGLESTILYYFKGTWRLLRKGALPKEALTPITGPIVKLDPTSEILCPGTRYRHYAPKARLHLGLPEKKGIILGFEERDYPMATEVFSLGSLRNPDSVAHSLYAKLRQLDQVNIEEAWIDMDFPTQGLWLTIEERIRKAAHSS